MLEYLVVGVGGFLGSCLRFTLTKIVKYFNIIFPLGTLLSNVIAGLSIGFIIGLEQQSIALSPRTKLFLTTGLLGGLSTFSTFSLETVSLLNDGKYLLASVNILLNLGLSLSGVAFGMICANLIFKKA